MQESIIAELKNKIEPNKINRLLLKRGEAPIQKSASLHDLLKRPKVTIGDLGSFFIDKIKPGKDVKPFFDEILVEVESIIKYSGYIKRQKDQVERLQKQEKLIIPKNTNYYEIKSISSEAQEKLSLVKPETLGQATRVSGVTPADISVLSVAFSGR